MLDSKQKPVAIVGAGIAGLTAAAFLQKRRIPVVLYEAGAKLAGLAASFQDQEGFSYDFGAHFITNRLAAALGLSANCRMVRYYGESVRLRGRTYSYPFGLLQEPRFLAGGLASRLAPVGDERKNSSAAEWFRAAYGTALANEVALPLLEAWSGVSASELAASVGSKLQNTIGQTLLLRLASRLTNRAVACGYSHEVAEDPSVWHVYPEGGTGALCQHLADQLQGVVQLNSPVEAILVEQNRVKAVQVNGREQPAAAVISTAPCPILAKLVRGTTALQPLARFRYRPMVFVNLRFQGRGLLSDTVLWTPEAEFPFFRLTETPLSMPWLAPEGKTLITVDLGCEVGDSIWQMEDTALGQFCLDHLRSIIPNAEQRYLGCRVLRTPIAYPVLLNEYEAERQRLSESTGIEGLYSIGRNGEFAHILMEDIYWRTLKKMSQVLAFLEQQTSSQQFSSPAEMTMRG
jgi:protoporphyrinogen/coproporphyrinogen III oxidase